MSEGGQLSFYQKGQGVWMLELWCPGASNFWTGTSSIFSWPLPLLLANDPVS
jgi:hypothetical protein